VSDAFDSGPEAGPWVLVADGFSYTGGMERANAAFANYLCEAGTAVHLVSYRIDPALGSNPAVTTHLAKTPARSAPFGLWHLDQVGRQVAKEVTARHPRARVLVNGSNCSWPDLNWVHYVHRAWRPQAIGAPLWYKAKAAGEHWLHVRRERRIVPQARLILANSERTRQDLIDCLAVDPERIRIVHLGTDSDWRHMTPARRAAARAWLGKPPDRPLVLFAGAIGHDSRKGFDTLWSAWEALCRHPQWDADLIVAGGGRRLPFWRERLARSGLGERVKLLGFSDRVADLLAAADLLASPARYESYGLNVQEALCCGVPAIVSARAGVAERFTPDMKDLLLDNPHDAAELAAKMLNWRAKADTFKRLTLPLAAKLRAYTWHDMAERMVTLARGSSPAEARTAINQ